jgi:hypothetical protein
VDRNSCGDVWCGTTHGVRAAFPQGAGASTRLTDVVEVQIMRPKHIDAPQFWNEAGTAEISVRRNNKAENAVQDRDRLQRGAPSVAGEVQVNLTNERA